MTACRQSRSDLLFNGKIPYIRVGKGRHGKYLISKEGLLQYFYRLNEKVGKWIERERISTSPEQRRSALVGTTGFAPAMTRLLAVSALLIKLCSDIFPDAVSEKMF